jgi:hypothetical protein
MKDPYKNKLESMSKMVTWQNGNRYGKIDERLKDVCIIREYDGPVGTVIYNDNGTSIFHHVHHNELTYVDDAVLDASRRLESMKMNNYTTPDPYVIENKKKQLANGENRFTVSKNQNLKFYPNKTSNNTLVLNTSYEVRGGKMVQKEL